MTTSGVPSTVRIEQEGLPPFYAFSHLQADGTAFCGFSSRQGGVSEGPYASLNLGTTTADTLEKVTQNRALLQAAYGHPLTEWIRLEHGRAVHLVDDAVVRARQGPQPVAVPSADAVITQLPGVPLTIYYADCVPVVLVDPVRRALGLVHAGWRGTVAGVIAATVEAMQRHFGSRPADLLAGLGSSIGPCCFEVGPEVVALVREHFAAWQDSVVLPLMMESSGEQYCARVSKGTEADERLTEGRRAAPETSITSCMGPGLLPGGQRRGVARIDLWRLNVLQLEAAGLPTGQIEVSRLCTACQSETFYSYRRDQGITGRLAMTAVLVGTSA